METTTKTDEDAERELAAALNAAQRINRVRELLQTELRVTRDPRALTGLLQLNAARVFALARLRRARDRVMGVERVGHEHQGAHSPAPSPERRP
jgi:hypothetical protein